MATALAWAFACGYIVAKVLDAIGAIRSARRDAERKIAEARKRQ